MLKNKLLVNRNAEKKDIKTRRQRKVLRCKDFVWLGFFDFLPLLVFSFLSLVYFFFINVTFPSVSFRSIYLVNKVAFKWWIY